MRDGESPARPRAGGVPTLDIAERPPEDEAATEAQRAPAPHRSREATRHPGQERRGRYRRRETTLADGTRLVLNADGTLVRLDAAGRPERTLAPEDPEWAQLALRFGLRVQPPTVRPTGRVGGGLRPARG